MIYNCQFSCSVLIRGKPIKVSEFTHLLIFFVFLLNSTSSLCPTAASYRLGSG